MKHEYIRRIRELELTYVSLTIKNTFGIPFALAINEQVKCIYMISNVHIYENMNIKVNE